jgi:drug/metabolite transporter (DMT)-like permease
MLFGVAAAVAFGASTPFAKRLLGDVGPQMLAGLLYLGAFVVLAVALPSRRRRGEARLRLADLPRLAGVVAAGGVIAPVLMLVGLERVSGMTGSLLLNLEGPFTLVLALAFFGEHLGRRSLVGSVAVFVAAALLSFGGPMGGDQLVGVILIGAAAALWAFDNNLTQSLTGRDPFAIVAVKAGAAAAVNLAIAGLLGAVVPGLAVVLGALVLGAVAYGVSILFDAYALRLIGAARESAVFATAPFVGVLMSIPVLGERLSAVELVAALLMVAGVVVLFRDRHEHIHAHEALEHEHVHRHDDQHHEHDHGSGVDPAVPHSHLHRHEPLVHSHPHVSDSHHRHRHSHGQADRAA